MVCSLYSNMLKIHQSVVKKEPDCWLLCVLLLGINLLLLYLVPLPVPTIQEAQYACFLLMNKRESDFMLL